MLTDKQIEELSHRMNIPLAGVDFKDNLPKKLIPNKTYIINLQDDTDDEGNPNGGTHWTMLQVNKTPKGNYKPIYFDSYGAPPPEIVKKRVKDCFKIELPHTDKDIQSLMNNACGYYCLAFSHYINTFPMRTNDLYIDTAHFLDLFDDLNESIDWKKNEYVLKMFFQSADKDKRKPVDVISQSHADYERIINKEGGNIDIMKLPVKTNIMNRK